MLGCRNRREVGFVGNVGQREAEAFRIADDIAYGD